MIDTILGATGLIYAIGKDALAYVNQNNKKSKKQTEFKSAQRIVDFNYPNESGIKDKWEKKGFEIIWAHPRKIEAHTRDGFEVIYEIDEPKKEIFSLSCWNNEGARPADLTLMARKKSNP